MKYLTIIFVLVLFVVPGCRRHGPDGIPFEHHHDLKYEPFAKDASPGEASRVKIHETIHERTEGIRFTQSGPLKEQAAVAPGYAHRILGVIELKESVDVAQYDRERLDAAFKNEALRARREKLLLAEAARHGANALYKTTDFSDGVRGLPGRTRHYLAVYLSPDPPQYPDVETLLERLELSKQGYKEVKRFTAKLEDLPTREPETIQLKRGHCYMFAIAFHPERIERPHRKVTSINFRYKVPNPVVFPGTPVLHGGAGGFTERREDMTMTRSDEVLDGIWSRTGAGTIACPVYRTQPAELSFTTFQGRALKNPPPFAPGRGTADFVVYEQKLSDAEYKQRACGRCIETAQQCSHREPLASCTALSSCLQTTGLPLAACADQFR